MSIKAKRRNWPEIIGDRVSKGPLLLCTVTPRPGFCADFFCFQGVLAALGFQDQRVGLGEGRVMFKVLGRGDESSHL